MIDVADVVAQWGAYYIANPDAMAKLRNMIYAKIQTASYFQDRPTSDTYWRSSQAQIDRVVQPFQKAWTPIGTVKFTPNEFPLYKLKIDKEETPDDIEATYLGFLADVLELDRAQWPFVRWLIENHILPRKQQDLETNEHWGGVFVTPTPGVAGAAGTAMNGVRKVIRTYAAAGKTNLGDGAIATGAIADDPKDFVYQVEGFMDDVPKLIRPGVRYLFMSETNAIRYSRGRRAIAGSMNSSLSFEERKQLEDYPNVSVVGLLGMGTSDMIWTSIPDNMIRPIKKAPLANTMRVESLKRQVFLFTDWWEALNFEYPGLVFHNDQDLA